MQWWINKTKQSIIPTKSAMIVLSTKNCAFQDRKRIKTRHALTKNYLTCTLIVNLLQQLIYCHTLGYYSTVTRKCHQQHSMNNLFIFRPFKKRNKANALLSSTLSITHLYIPRKFFFVMKDVCDVVVVFQVL